MDEEVGAGDAVYQRFCAAAKRFRSLPDGQKLDSALQAEMDHFDGLPAEDLETMRARFDKEEERTRALQELVSIGGEEVAHDRREMAVVVDGLVVAVEEGRVVRGADYLVDEGPEGRICCFEVSRKDNTGTYHVLLATNKQGQVVGYCDFSCVADFMGGDFLTGSGTIMVDVSERGVGRGSALNLVARRIFQQVADKTRKPVFRSEANRNASLGRPMEQRRWQRISASERFKPNPAGVAKEDSGLSRLDKSGQVLSREEIKREELGTEVRNLRKMVIG